MAGNKKIGAGLALDGEKEFKQAITGINKDLAVLRSEMGKVTAQFDGNADSMEALTAKQAVYNKQADEQRKKIEETTKALENAKKEFGENSDKVKDWQIKLNRAESDLAKTENSLKDTTDKIDKFGNEADDAGKEVEKAGKKAEQSGKDAEKGQSGWSKLGSGLAKVGQIAGKAVMALGAGAAAAATGVAAMTAKAASNADEINTLAKQTGLSTEEIQKFQYASETIDVPLETLTGSMAKLTRNMESARLGSKNQTEAFAALGISITDNEGKLRSNQDVFNEAIDALGKMENETQRDAYAMQLFGKSAQDLNPLILGGAEDLKKLGEEAEAAGLILGQDALDNLNSFQDAMDKFKATSSGSGSLFATAFAGPMAEGLNTITGYMTQLTGAFQSGGFSGMSDAIGGILSDIIAKISEYLPKIMEMGLNIITKLIEGVSQNLPAIVEAASQVIMMLVNSLLELLPSILKMGLEIIKELAAGIAKSLPELIPVIVDTVLMIVETLIDNIDMLVDASIAIILALADGLMDALPKLIDKVPVIIVKLVQALSNNIPKLIETGIKLVVALANGLIQAIPQLVSKIPEIVMAIVNAFKNYYSKLWDIGKDMVSGIWNGIKSMGQWISDKVSGFFSGVVDGIKGFLGIHSPSKVFAGIGENMAAGIGEGFGSEIEGVARRINKSIPTSFDINSNYNSGGSKAEYTLVTPIYLNGKEITRSVSQIQYENGRIRARGIGVMPA